MSASFKEDCPDYDEFVAEARMSRSHSRALARHPSCNDPDHPGCSLCVDDEEDEEE